MPLYPWNCLACEATNPAAASTCGRCGCPASATARQVTAARDGWRRREGLPPVRPANTLALWAQVPWLLIAGALFAVLGTLALILDMSPGWQPAGDLLLALAALCAASYRRPPPSG